MHLCRLKVSGCISFYFTDADYLQTKPTKKLINIVIIVPGSALRGYTYRRKIPVVRRKLCNLIYSCSLKCIMSVSGIDFASLNDFSVEWVNANSATFLREHNLQIITDSKDSDNTKDAPKFFVNDIQIIPNSKWCVLGTRQEDPQKILCRAQEYKRRTL